MDRSITPATRISAAQQSIIAMKAPTMRNGGQASDTAIIGRAAIM